MPPPLPEIAQAAESLLVRPDKIPSSGRRWTQPAPSWARRPTACCWTWAPGRTGAAQAPLPGGELPARAGLPRPAVARHRARAAAGGCRDLFGGRHHHHRDRRRALRHDARRQAARRRAWRRRASWSRATASSTRARLSTVYMPGDKTPCSQRAFSLDAGRAVPALSLYVTADPETGEVLESETRLERVMVRENLRHNMLDAQVTEASLADPAAELPWPAPALEAGAGAVGAARERARQARKQLARRIQLLPGRQPRRPTPRCGWCRASATRRWTAWWPST